MLKKTLVSVVIPTLNSGRTLARCLESIRNLDRKNENLEILVVDGGSTDNTLQIAQSFRAKILTEPKGIRGATYNRGLREAAGEYVGFVDSDGVVSPSWLREGLCTLSKDTSMAAVYFKSELPTDATIFQKIAGIYQIKSMATSKWGGAHGAVFRRGILETVGGFDERMRYRQDDELTHRLLEAGYRIVIGKRNLVSHYPRGNIQEYFIQQIEEGIGYVKLYELLHQNRALAYIVCRSTVALLPAIALILMARSLVPALTIVAGLGIFSLAYLAYLFLKVERRYRMMFFMLLSLPLNYVSCLGSFIGYITGLRYYATRRRAESE